MPTDSDKPRLKIKRRPSDFAGSGPVFFQMGTTTCCCCLHWVGAVVGVVGGLVSGHREANLDDPAKVTHPELRRFVITGYLLGIVNSILGLVVVAVLVSYGPLGALAERVGIVVVFVPALVALPIGASAYLGAMAAQWIVVRDEPSFMRYATGYRFAGRVTWQLLLWMSVFSSLGYLVMLAIALVAN